MARTRKEKPRLESIKVYCPNLKMSLEIMFIELTFTSMCSPCDLCGDHGNVTVDFSCECGKRHEIELDSW